MDGGLDHEVTDTGGPTLRRRRVGDDGLAPAPEARLLRLVAGRVGVRVPQVVALPAPDVMEIERIPGSPLLAALPVTAADAPELGALLGRVVAGLAAVPAADVSGLVPVDDAGLDEYLAEAAEIVADVRGEIPAGPLAGVDRFLAAAPPAEPARRVLVHGDLGAEHVFIDTNAHVTGSRFVVTGIIDWSDAAIGDPALDLGLIRRDLGRLGFDAALRSLPATASGQPRPVFAARALFHARVRTLEDLAFGLDAGSAEHLRNARRAIADLFAEPA